MDFFHGLHGNEINCEEAEEKVFLAGPCLSNQQTSPMCEAISNIDIKEAIFSNANDKAPDPDGYSAAFF